MIKFRTTSYIILTTVITVLLLSACNNNITSSTNESSSLSTTTTSEVFPVIYTVVFDARGGSEVEAQQVGENELLIVPHTLKQGYTLEGWYTSLENNSTRLKWDFSVDKVTSDLTLYANWSVNEYTISFVSNGGSEIASIKQEYMTIVTEPQQPSKTGHTFIGWFSDENLSEAYTFTTMPAENITLYAKWSINAYTISFDTKGGDAVTNIVQEYDSILTLPTSSKVGYSFVAWYMDDQLTIAFTLLKMPAENITLYAKWSINEYTIKFVSNGGSEIAAIRQEYSTIVTEPQQPTKTGHTFAGWFSDESLNEPYIFTTMPSANITLYAKWEALQYSLTYKVLQNSTVKKLFAGDRNGFAITANNRVYAWGNNEFGQLGNGTKFSRSTPIEITNMFEDTVISLAVGTHFTVALTANGSVYTWGNNSIGQLGNGTLDEELSPINITASFDDKVISIVSGGYHTLALTSKGDVYVWGSNSYGQLGVSANNTITRKEPVKITANFDEEIVSLEAGFYHSLALSITGRVYTFGWNQYGQLGDGTNVMKTVPVEITSRLEGRVVSLSAGHSHNLALTSTGRLYAWGSDDHGQLGDATTVAKNSPVEITSYFSEKILSLTSGFYFNLALSENDLVFAWGSNDYAQLGDNTKTKRLIAIEISSRFNGIVTSVYAGQYHSLALTSNNEYYAWGYNSNGQFGDGSTTNRFVPLKIEDYFYDFVVYFVEYYDFGSSINNIQEPSKPGYIFHGWYSDKDFLDRYTFGLMPNDNIILYGYFSSNS